MRYYVYRITNLTNNKYYIGKHSTSKCEEEDYYMGSSQSLNNDIQMNGIQNFQKEIIYEASSEEDALKYEAKIVTKEMIQDPKCYNKVVGGRGSWRNPTTENYSKEHEINNFNTSMFDKDLIRPKYTKQNKSMFNW